MSKAGSRPNPNPPPPTETNKTSLKVGNSSGNGEDTVEYARQKTEIAKQTAERLKYEGQIKGWVNLEKAHQQLQKETEQFNITKQQTEQRQLYLETRVREYEDGIGINNEKGEQLNGFENRLNFRRQQLDKETKQAETILARAKAVQPFANSCVDIVHLLKQVNKNLIAAATVFQDNEKIQAVNSRRINRLLSYVKNTCIVIRRKLEV